MKKNTRHFKSWKLIAFVFSITSLKHDNWLNGLETPINNIYVIMSLYVCKYRLACYPIYLSRCGVWATAGDMQWWLFNINCILCYVHETELQYVCMLSLCNHIILSSMHFYSLAAINWKMLVVILINWENMEIVLHSFSVKSSGNSLYIKCCIQTHFCT